MAISPRMLAVIQKIEAADAKHMNDLRERAQRDKEDKESNAGAKKRGHQRPLTFRSPSKQGT